MKHEDVEKNVHHPHIIPMSKSFAYTRFSCFLLCLSLIAACQKDNDTINWSPTQALPPDTTNTGGNPIDTNETQNLVVQWQAVLIGDEAFFGDTSTIAYAYDSLASLHEFSCFDSFGRQMILRMPDLELGADTLSFSSTATITLIDGPLVFDTSFNPNGYINIYANANGRISALFESDLNDNAGSGQEKELVNGIIQNIPYQ